MIKRIEAALYRAAMDKTPARAPVSVFLSDALWLQATGKATAQDDAAIRRCLEAEAQARQADPADEAALDLLTTQLATTHRATRPAVYADAAALARPQTLGRPVEAKPVVHDWGGAERAPVTHCTCPTGIDQWTQPSRICEYCADAIAGDLV